MPEAQFSALPSNFHAPLSPPPCSYSKKLLVLIQSATRSGAYKGRDTRFLPPTRALCNYLLGFACWSAQKGGKAQKNARIKAPYHLWFNLQYLFVDKVSLINSTAVLHTRSLVSDEKKKPSYKFLHNWEYWFFQETYLLPGAGFKTKMNPKYCFLTLE